MFASDTKVLDVISSLAVCDITLPKSFSGPTTTNDNSDDAVVVVTNAVDYM